MCKGFKLNKNKLSTGCPLANAIEYKNNTHGQHTHTRKHTHRTHLNIHIRQILINV